MRFLDRAKIHIESGTGGAGCCSFARQRNLRRGPPDGGNGGIGGAVWVCANRGLKTLADYRYRRHFRARGGTNGSSRLRTGAKGNDNLLQVPLGTQVLDEYQNDLLADLTQVNQSVLLLAGGEGGWGNAHYKSSLNRSPRRSEPGQEGRSCWVWLQLKLLAEVGLVGLPNAGKSTLLGVCSAAKAKVADYPFTTLIPQLGVVSKGEIEFTLIEVPGLIEGASLGRGLGQDFLAHLERCQILLHLVDATGDVVRDYRIIRAELEAYGHGLASKPSLVALTKADICHSVQLDTAQSQLSCLVPNLLLLSAVRGQGIEQALKACWTTLKAHSLQE